MAALELRLLDFIRWLGVLGTLIFWVVTIWFFIAARGWALVGFMVASLFRMANRNSTAKEFKLTPGAQDDMKKNVWRAVIEVSFIIFLFYSNLLMGEFERSGMGEKRGLTWAMADVFTSFNFGIALIAALVGYVLFEFLRKRF